MANQFIQVPPQSTGKRVASIERTEIVYDNQIDTWTIGATVTGATSSASGVITGINTSGFSATSGELYLSSVMGTFVDNEFIQIEGATKATTNLQGSPQQTIATQSVILSDPNNPNNQQKIDKFGATINSFTDGSPVFGAFGTMTVGEPQTIADYRFAYDNRDSDWYDINTGSGTTTHEAATGASLLSCTTLAGDVARRTSHAYHDYIPGVGTLVEMSVAASDQGKVNVRRRWGYFDDNNGIFFELNDTSLRVVLRSNVSGSVIDTVIEQSDWSDDKVDGSDSEGFNLDITKGNIFWIDFQWLGAGRVRYGVMDNLGSRVVMHIIENANTNPVFPYMRTATLPIRIEQENTAGTGSGSELRLVCATVKHSSKAIARGIPHSTSSPLTTLATASGEVPILSIRPKTMFNGFANHATIRGMSFTLTNVTGTGGAPVIFRFRQGIDAHLTGEVFAEHSTSSITETDTTATAVSTAAHTSLNYVVSKDMTSFVQNIDDRTVHSFQLELFADETTQPCIILTAECLGGTDAQIIATLNWEEILL